MVVRAVCGVRRGSLGEPPGGTDHRANKDKGTELGPTLAPYFFSVSRALPSIINSLYLLIYEK